MIIDIARDYTDAPGGRYIREGKFSGEDFRKTVLEPAFAKNTEKIIIDLDGTYGYSPSFLEEAFGGLVRLHKWTQGDISLRLAFISIEDRALPEYIKACILGGDLC